MEPARIPSVLAERLGDDASAALLGLFAEQSRACVDGVMRQCTERFERRLVEETSTLRLEMAQLRQEMHDGFSSVRQEMNVGLSAVRQEMNVGLSAVRQEMHAGRFELLKWAFVFWVGQLVSVAGIVGLLLRTVPAR
jgi:hypothetical protein